MFLVFTALNDAYAGYNTPHTRLKVSKIRNNNTFDISEECQLR